MRRTILYITVGLLLTGCTAGNDEWLPAATGDGEAIAFGASMTEMGSRRAANETETTAALQTVGGFGVFGCYTGQHRYADSNVTSDFMYNQQVTSLDGGTTWSYEPVKYWLNGEGESSSGTGATVHYVSFFAYAPYSNQRTDNAAGYTIPTFSLQHEVGNPWLTYRLHNDVAQQVDLLYAVPLMNRIKPGSDQKLQFTFRHALACAGDQVRLTMADELRTMYKTRIDANPTHTEVVVTLTGVTVRYQLTEKARLVLWTGSEPNWQPIISENALTTRSVSLEPTDSYSLPYELYRYDGTTETIAADWQDAGHGVYYIPLHIDGSPQTAEVTLAYDVVTTISGTPMTVHKTSTTTLTLSDYVSSYQAGKHLFFNLTLIKE